MKENICTLVVLVAIVVLAAVSGAFSDGAIGYAEYGAIAGVCLLAIGVSAKITRERTDT